MRRVLNIANKGRFLDFLTETIVLPVPSMLLLGIYVVEPIEQESNK